MSSKLINIFTNEMPASCNAMKSVSKTLQELGYTVSSDYSSDASLIICIGGDGAFLETVHSCDFTDIPILGVNTGHLGFFEEITADEFDSFFRKLTDGRYRVQNLNTVEATVITRDGTIHHHKGLNEVAIRGKQGNAVHLQISIDNKLIQNFSGDGILCATSSGSTAYNYSLGGSIVDPRLDLLQVTPISPMNNIAYRSFTSSILLPSDRDVEIIPDPRENVIYVYNDGFEKAYDDVAQISVKVSETVVKLIRSEDYDFWSKVKSKFL